MGFMSLCEKTGGNNACDWDTGVIRATGSEIGLEDFTVEFPPHGYQHHNGQGFNGPALDHCTNCWIKNVKVINADEGFPIRSGGQNTLDGVEVVGGYHNYIHMTTTSQNLVTNFKVSSGSIHGLSGNWGTTGGVYSNGFGTPVKVEPDHNGPRTTGLLYSNIQGTGGQGGEWSDTYTWNYMNQTLCPIDIHQAQLDYRHGVIPDPEGCPFDNLARCATASTSSVWSSSYTPNKVHDGNTDTRWNSASHETSGAWIMLDFDEEIDISRVVLKEVYSRIRAYRLQSWDSAAWVDIATGTTVGTSKAMSFNQVNTSAIRLLVDRTVNTTPSGTPTISEFEVYE